MVSVHSGKSCLVLDSLSTVPSSLLTLCPGCKWEPGDPACRRQGLDNRRPQEGTGARGAGALYGGPVPGSRTPSDLPTGASDGAHARCWLVIFNPFNNSIASTFILLREGKNLSNLPTGRKALVIMSRPELRPKSAWFQSTHILSAKTIVFPVSRLARYFWPKMPSFQLWFLSIK